MSADFLDSNVFVYMFNLQDVRKRRIATEIVTAAVESTRTITSFQVVQETLNVITRRTNQLASREDAAQFLADVLAPLWTVHPSPALYRRALEIHHRYHHHFYDSLILAAALEAGCDRLISEDFQHGQTIDGLKVHNPFL